MAPFEMTQQVLDRSIVSLGGSSRLHRVFEKIRRGDPTTIGVIGGSITQWVMASEPKYRYANRIVSWLQSRFKQTSFTLINAGRGATGSNYACLRARRDLLCQRPDLVILEFAVNDGPDEVFGETSEGLVRQVLCQPQAPAAVMLFMMRRDGTNAQERLQSVGFHYGLPMTSYRDALWPEITAGRLAWEAISPDEVHPNDLGHELAARCVIHLLQSSLHQADGSAVSGIPQALYGDRFERTQLLEAPALVPVASKGWSLDAHGEPWPCWVALDPGSVISFDVNATTILLMFYRKNGPFGRAAVKVDDRPEQVYDAWFEQTWGGYRETVIVVSDLSPGTHRVTLRTLIERHESSTGHEFRLLGIGLAGVAASHPPTR